MPDSPNNIISDIERIREENIRRQEELLAALFKSEEFLESHKALQELNFTARSKENTKQFRPKKPKHKKSEETDQAFRFFGYIPTERRRSARLENKDPEFTQYDLPDDDLIRSKRSYREDDDELADLEKIVSEPKIKRTSTKREVARVIINVEDVTDAMIKNISRSVKDKVYSENGTSCHQCRQKTLDQKTNCRNRTCIGVRGQVCGVCAKNRYGESVEEALKNPNWHCYVCRGICNCSFCRARAGKRPTGILAPIATKTGYNSVKDFLDSLRGVGDFPEEDLTNDTRQIMKQLGVNNNTDEDCLGFATGGREVVLSGGQILTLSCVCNKACPSFKISLPNPEEKDIFLESLGVSRKIKNGINCELKIGGKFDNNAFEFLTRNTDRYWVKKGSIVEYKGGCLLGFDTDGNAVLSVTSCNAADFLGFSDNGSKMHMSNGIILSSLF